MEARCPETDDTPLAGAKDGCSTSGAWQCEICRDHGARCDGSLCGWNRLPDIRSILQTTSLAAEWAV